MKTCPSCGLTFNYLNPTHVESCALVPPLDMLVRIYQHGVSVNKISLYYGVSNEFIWSLLRRAPGEVKRLYGREEIPDWAPPPAREALDRGDTCKRCEIIAGTYLRESGKLIIELNRAGLCQWCAEEEAAAKERARREEEGEFVYPRAWTLQMPG